MTEQEIIEGNKLIAEFMGDYRAKYKVSNDYTLANAMLKTLKYHSDWNLLIPVLEEISKHAVVYEIGNKLQSLDNTWYRCTIECYMNGGIKYISQSGVTIIEATWLAVIKLIKWYNKIKEVPMK